jgi:hypothetical protein
VLGLECQEDRSLKVYLPLFCGNAQTEQQGGRSAQEVIHNYSILDILTEVFFGITTYEITDDF